MNFLEEVKEITKQKREEISIEIKTKILERAKQGKSDCYLAVINNVDINKLKEQGFLVDKIENKPTMYKVIWGN